MPRLSPAATALTELTLQVFRANGALLAAGDGLGAPSGVSSARWQVLGLVDHQAMTVAEVARQMGLTRQSVLQTADAMAGQGLVAYVPNPKHARAKLLRITPKGTRVLRATEARHAAWANRVAKRLSLPLVSAAAGTLQKLLETLENEG